MRETEMTGSDNLESQDRPLTVEFAAERAIAEFGDEAAGYAAMCADYCFVCGYAADAVTWARAAELIRRLPATNTGPVH
jgi:hypothetical protein